MTLNRTCYSCGASLSGLRIDARYCSPTCRQRGRRGVTGTSNSSRFIPGGLNGSTATLSRLDPHKSSISNSRKCGGHPARINAQRLVIDIEVFGGRSWRQTVSSDGVICNVGRLRSRTLCDRGAR
jgi:hypothetical protein